jgi:hypothetical protein
MPAFDRIKETAVLSEVTNKFFLRVVEVLHLHAYHNFSGTWWIPSASTGRCSDASLQYAATIFVQAWL